MATNNFGADFAAQLADYFISGTDITAPPTNVYITLYDDTGAELNGSLQNGRVAIAPGTDFQQGADATVFENGVEVNFGEATADITVSEFAIKDNDATDTNALEYYRGDVTGAPLDFSDGVRVFFSAGELSVDILDQTNN